MGSKQTFAIDFGSENIRMARSMQNVQAPQVLRPNLLNAARVDRNQGVTAVGDTVYDGVASGSVILATNIFDEKLGSGAQQALNALLKDVFRRFELERVSVEDKSVSETVFSLPIGYSRNDSKSVALRLLENGFPAPRAYPVAQAIFLSYFQEKKLQPGRYLVLDCGALHTRMAVCTIDSSRRFSQVEQVSGDTGGREIDRILTQHFSKMVNGSQISGGEILEFVRQFKKGFLNKVLQGSTKFVSRSPFSSGPPAFDLNLEDFERLSDAYFKTFEEFIHNFLDQQQIPTSNLSGVLLAGANSQWPFITRFVGDLAGKEKVYVNEFPEEIIVKGLILSALEGQPAASLDAVSDKAKMPHSEVRTQEPSKPVPEKNKVQRTLIKPHSHVFPFWLAVLLELFPGLVGILGIGWWIGTATIFGLPLKGQPWWKLLFLRVPFFFIWPIILAGFVALLVGASVQLENAWVLILTPVVWCGIPFASAFLAFWASKNMK